MRTTLNLPDQSMNKILRLTKAKTKTEAVTKVIDDYIRREKIRDLIELRGKLHFDENWMELEKLELKEYENNRR
jgi:hypothetical protein